MRSARLLPLLFTSFSTAVTACGPSSPAATTPAPAAAAPTAAPTAEPKAPMPYTAAEIREATGPGRTYRYRVEAAKEPVRIQEMVFVVVTDEGADVRQTTYDLDGKAVGEPRTPHLRWEDLRRHAEFPAAHVTITEERVTVPAGAFDCKVYAVREGEEMARYSFAKTMPGAPVLIVAEKNGVRVLTQTLLEHRPGKR